MTTTTPTTAHATFTVERTYPASLARVWAAFSDPVQKKRWFESPPEWEDDVYSMDFRVGGIESSVGGPPGGEVQTYTAVFYDIVPEQRIVSAYEMLTGDRRISVSLTTTELEPVDGGVHVTFTEQGVYFDEGGAAEREHGSGWLLDTLGTTLAD